MICWPTFVLLKPGLALGSWQVQENITLYSQHSQCMEYRFLNCLPANLMCSHVMPPYEASSKQWGQGFSSVRPLKGTCVFHHPHISKGWKSTFLNVRASAIWSRAASAFLHSLYPSRLRLTRHPQRLGGLRGQPVTWENLKLKEIQPCPPAL